MPVTSATLKGSQPAIPPPAENPNDFMYYNAIFYVLLDAMSVRQGTVLIESKEISRNASVQDQLNKENGSIKFSILPTNAGTNTINQVQDKNEEYAALRENIQNSLITARQTAEVTMTQASTNIDTLQQDASEDSSWLSTLNTIFQVISEMNQRP